MNRNQNLLYNEGIDIIVNGSNKIDSILANIHFKIPDRRDGRKNYRRENYIIFRYIAMMNKNNLLSFPLYLKRLLWPDFTKSYNNNIGGDEITEATSEAYQKAITEWDNDSSIEGLDLNYFSYEKRHDNQFSEKGLIKKDNDTIDYYIETADVMDDWINFIFDRMIMPLALKM